MGKEVKASVISGICMIIAAVIGIFSININIENNALKDENENLKSEKMELDVQAYQPDETYDTLKNMCSNLEKENDDLKNHISILESELSQYDSLVEENAQLKVQISQLRDLLVSEKKNNESTVQDIGNKEDNEIIYIQVNAANGARIRSAPESSSSLVGGAERGKRFLLLDTVIGSDELEWCEILVNGEKRYVRSDLVTIVE